MKIKITNNTINIVMYHYIRPIKGSKYQVRIEVKEFENQINFFKKRKYNFWGQLINNINKKKISKNQVFFDIWWYYKDHFQYIFPILMKIK